MIAFKAKPRFIYNSAGQEVDRYFDETLLTIGRINNLPETLTSKLQTDVDIQNYIYYSNDIMTYVNKILKQMQEEYPDLDIYNRGELYLFTKGTFDIENGNYFVFRCSFDFLYIKYENNKEQQVGAVGTAQYDDWFIETGFGCKWLITECSNIEDILKSHNSGMLIKNPIQDYYQAYYTQSNGKQWINVRENVYLLLKNADYSYEIPDNKPGTDTPVGPGQGDSDFEGEINDNIPLPDLWGINPALDSGFIKAYNPTILQIQQLASAMWSQNIGQQIKNIFSNITDGIISLGLLPFQMPTTPEEEEIKFGWIGTGVSMKRITQQNIQIPFQEVLINNYYSDRGSDFLDYSPYTKASIYLPFIGHQQLDINDIINRGLNLTYNIDVLTGDCVAHLQIGSSDLYNWSGNCMMHLPISSESFKSLFSGLLGIGASFVAGGIAPAITTAVLNSQNLKPQINHGGNLDGVKGFLGTRFPYIYIERPRRAEPDLYATFVAKPSNETITLSQLTGFTKVKEIHLENIPATDSELKEIESLLKEGVIF